MEFSTIELFQLNLICLNQIKSISNHKCLNWVSNSVLINKGFLSILGNPSVTVRVFCSEDSPLHQERPLSLDILFIHMLPCDGIVYFLRSVYCTKENTGYVGLVNDILKYSNRRY